jgi:hypothetical protein
LFVRSFVWPLPNKAMQRMMVWIRCRGWWIPQMMV